MSPMFRIGVPGRDDLARLVVFRQDQAGCGCEDLFVRQLQSRGGEVRLELFYELLLLCELLLSRSLFQQDVVLPCDVRRFPQDPRVFLE